MNIIRLMTPKSQVAYINADCSVRQGLEKMRYHGYNALPVLDAEGLYVGVVKDADFLWLMMDEGGGVEALEDIPLTRIIRFDNPPVLISASIEELMERSLENNFVPLIDDRGCFIGIVRRRQLLTYFEKKYLKGRGQTPSAQ